MDTDISFIDERKNSVDSFALLGEDLKGFVEETENYLRSDIDSFQSGHNNQFKTPPEVLKILDRMDREAKDPVERRKAAAARKMIEANFSNLHDSINGYVGVMGKKMRSNAGFTILQKAISGTMRTISS